MQSTSWRESPWTSRVLTGVAIVPIVVAVVRALAADRLQLGDNGLLSLRVADVAGPHHPWLGSWTSASQSFDENVNNPGAWYAYLAAPVVALAGPNAGAVVAVGLMNAAAVLGIGEAARRIEPRGFRPWMLVAAAVLAWAMGSALLVDLWQPHALLLPLLLALVLAVGVAAGRAWFLAPFVGVVSLIVQTHLGHAVVLGLTSLSVCVVGAWYTRGSWSLAESVRSRPLWAAAGTAGVAWAPAIIEQIANGSDGNLARLARSADDADLVLGGDWAVRIVARVLVLPPAGIRAAFADTPPNTLRTETADGPTVVIDGLPSTVVSVLAVAGLLAVIALLFRHASRTGAPPAPMTTALLVAGIVVLAALVALSRLVVGSFAFATHHVRWLYPVAVFVMAVIAWALVTWVRERVPRLEPVATALPLVLVVGLSLWNLAPYQQYTGPTVEGWAEPTLRTIERQLDATELPEPIVYVTDNLRAFEPFSGNVMAQLGDRGVEFRVEDPAWVRQVGRSREVDGTEVGRLRQLQSEDVVLYDGDECQIARAAGVSPEIATAGETLATQLTEGLLRGEVVRDLEALAADPRHDELLVAIATNDLEMVQRLVLQGTVAEWARRGALDPSTTAAIERSGREMFEWVRSHYALYLETDLPCPT